MGAFCTLLAQGVGVPTHSGMRLEDFLYGPLGLSRDYVDTHIQTIFVNGSAVDRLDEVAIHLGAVIALSAAMPGLAGATLRRGGRFSGMRREISHAQVAAGPAGVPTVITLKLFNMVFRDLAPRLFAQGLWIKAAQIRELIAQWGDRELSSMKDVLLDDRRIDPHLLAGLIQPDIWIAVRIDFFL